MPSVGKSDKWFIMVDSPRYVLRDLSGNGTIMTMAQWLDIDTMLAVFHQGKTKENPHFHAIVRMKKILDKQSIHVRLKSLFGVKKGQFSVQEWDGNDSTAGAGTYMFHEAGAEILVKKGYTAEQIECLRQKGCEISQVVEENKKRAEGRIPQRVLEKIKESGSCWSRRQVVEEICRMVKEGECYMPKGDYQMKSYVEEIMLKQTETTEQFDRYVDNMMNRLYGGYNI